MGSQEIFSNKFPHRELLAATNGNTGFASVIAATIQAVAWKS
jgi:hypothetical protein